MSRLLFVASEAFPLIKTGGLADVAGSLPEMLRQQGMDVRLLLPAYRDVMDTIETPTLVCELELADTRVQILETVLPGTGLKTWLLRHPCFSERGGDPYHDAGGDPWPDNAWRYLLLCRVAERICSGAMSPAWQPDVLHANDWHTGPAVALVHQNTVRPRTVFTIHNLAHLGLFDRDTFNGLGLPEHFWSPDILEFHDLCCFMKGGLVFADAITTVSPSYAREICSAPAGVGLEGLLSHRSAQLHGILNGIDEKTWDPARDPFLAHPFDSNSLERKAKNRAALQKELGLAPLTYGPMVGMITRLVEQKGIELLLPVVDDILAGPAQLAVLGTGNPEYESRLQELARAHPGSMSVTLTYNESLAHRIEASADLFLMPSLFEPCGLNQLYSLRYGTLPVVRKVGGLADTVVDASEENLAAGTATGFVFEQPESAVLLDTMRRALALWHDVPRWKAMQLAAMSQDFSWHSSATQYQDLYRAMLESARE
jgi:starch synthase